jgi:hypothetical protein
MWKSLRTTSVLPLVLKPLPRTGWRSKHGMMKKRPFLYRWLDFQMVRVFV